MIYKLVQPYNKFDVFIKFLIVLQYDKSINTLNDVIAIKLMNLLYDIYCLQQQCFFIFNIFIIINFISMINDIFTINYIYNLKINQIFRYILLFIINER